MRYLLVDRILEWKAAEKIRGIKNIAMSEDYLEYHFPRSPVMPGMLLLEALSQLAGWLEEASSDFSTTAFVTRVMTCKFYGFSLPGDQIELLVERVQDTDPAIFVYRALATAEGKKRVSAEFEAVTAPLSEIDDPEERRRFFAVLTRTLK